MENETKDSKKWVFERFPCSDYHLPVNYVRGHHFQNEFYWLNVARYFVHPYSCSSRVHRRLDFFSFIPSIGGKLGIEEMIKTCSLCQNKCFSGIDSVLQWRREKNLEMGKSFLFGVEDNTQFTTAAPISHPLPHRFCSQVIFFKA